MLKVIVATYNERPELKVKIKSPEFTSFVKGNVTYYLYLYNTDETLSDWQKFLPEQLIEHANFRQQQLSLLLFAEVDNSIYCVVGGHAYRLIIPFMDHAFGLNTYARIMKPEVDELASIKSRGITGHRAGIKEQFRNNYRIIDFVKFGKIPEEIHIKLSQEISDLHFHFVKSKKNERIQVSVGKGFKIKKEIDFEILHMVILELTTISELAASDYLSSYKEIQDQKLINEELYPEFITRIFNDIGGLYKRNNPTVYKFEHDFCNPNNIEKFYEADSYKLKEKTPRNGYTTFDELYDRGDIYDTVLKRAVDLHGESDRFKFMVYLQGVRVTCIKNHKTSVSSSFLFHISSEFTYKNKPVFLVDTKWYHLRPTFIHDLRNSTLQLLTTYKAPPLILHKPWDKVNISREGNYNFLYNGAENYIVIDTIIVDGVELCDLIYYDEVNIYLIHVKYGFTSQIRELNNQITIAARRLKDAIGSEDKSILRKIYNKLIEKDRSVNRLSEEQFLDLFKKRISFIMAFASHLNDDLLVEESIDKFDSNIARFSLIQCSSDMRSNYYDLLFCQIRRS
ncbi:DUF6119 family protein [Dyadobacter aurulentus]|uniref:DUF6119 family protein n=1 Tax=Dyadobacter sp. UC 10 TaxID=2605428 RepID=UPI0011F0DE7E|nr:DUF6119 family protein [Dyadobacter sp. UC 10]KAA0988706.1 hypothetical protein FXO21_00255 [Dyadobacter sp. UC 10]